MYCPDCRPPAVLCVRSRTTNETKSVAELGVRVGVQVSDELLVEVLWAAELLLLPGLKRLCAVRIGNALDPDSVLPVLKMSRMLNLSRLEEDCCAFMAGNLETVRGLSCINTNGRTSGVLNGFPSLPV